MLTYLPNILYNKCIPFKLLPSNKQLLHTRKRHCIQDGKSCESSESIILTLWTQVIIVLYYTYNYFVHDHLINKKIFLQDFLEICEFLGLHNFQEILEKCVGSIVMSIACPNLQHHHTIRLQMVKSGLRCFFFVTKKYFLEILK